MNILDIVIGVVLLLALLLGLKKGFLRGISGIVGMIGGIFLGVKLAPIIAPLMPPAGLALQVKMTAAFILMLVFSLATAHFIFYFLSKVMLPTPLKIIDRIFGMFLGVAKGLIFVVMITVILSITPLVRHLDDAEISSKALPYVKVIAKPMMERYTEKASELLDPKKIRARKLNRKSSTQ